MSNLYYNALKIYHGVFLKKHTGNVLVLLTPISKTEFLYVAILGRIPDTDKILGVSVYRDALSRLERVAEDDKQYFGDHYINIEKIPAEGKILENSVYRVKLKRPGKYIKSNLNIELDHSRSSADKKYYIIAGDIELVSWDIDPETVEAKAKRHLYLLRSR